MSIYKDTIIELLQQTKAYKEQKIDLENYQNAVWQAASAIVLVEEKNLRQFLQGSEGELELIRFTIDEAKTFEATLKIVDEIEARLLKEL